MKLVKTAACLLTSLAIAGCQAKSSLDVVPSLNAQAVSATLDAHPLIPYKTGPFMIIERENGEQSTLTIVSVTDESYSVEASDGRTWTNHANTFLPALEWSAEAWGQGSQEISEVTGNLFPLAVGNTMSMRVNGSSTLYPDGWEQSRECEVKAQERITIAAGEFDTYKIVCTQGDRVKVANFSPELNQVVSFHNVHTKDASRTDSWTLIESL